MFATANRPLVIFAGIVVALLVAVLVAVLVLVATLNAQEDQRAYEACMSRHGYSAEATPPRNASAEGYAAGIAAAAEACGR